MATSKKYNLDLEDGSKILKVLGYLLASTIVAFLITLLPQIELGSMSWLTPIINILLVALQKFIKENQ